MTSNLYYEGPSLYLKHPLIRKTFLFSGRLIATENNIEHFVNSMADVSEHNAKF